MLQDKSKSIDDRIYDFEKNPANQKAIVAYKHWQSLTDSERASIWSQWNSYYEECSVSDAAAIFQDMRKAFSQNDMPRFAELKVENAVIRVDRNFIPQPKSIDPYWVMNNQAISTYRTLVSEKARKTYSEGPGGIFT